MSVKRLFLVFACAISLLAVQAAEVSSQKASALAVQIMGEQFSSFTGSVKTVTPVNYQGQKAYYVVQFAPEGWALISADDRTEPLIGFSSTGTYVIEGQPETMTAVMECFSRRITDRSRHLEQKATGWDTGAQTRASSMRRTVSNVAPLIQVKFNQTSPYNQFCPKDGNGQAIVGCVAVAMAQAMSVAQWPAKPNGEYNYKSSTYGSLYINYDKEAAYDWSAILAGDKTAAAHLLYHCGVAVNMEYGIDGSGTQDYYIASALPRNFSYPVNAVKYYKRTDFDEAGWEDLILNELTNGRAVCLSGQDLKGGYGHCFNLDGYMNGAYSVNWGWGGVNNGYFTLNGLKDNKMKMDYSDPAYQSVIVGIRRPSENPSDILLSNKTVLAGKLGAEVGDLVVESEATNPVYTYEIVGEYNPLFHMNMPAPFEVKDGKLVTTEALLLEDGDRNITIKATNQKGASISRDFIIKVTSTSGIVEISAVPASAVYYNAEGVRLSQPVRGVNVVKYTYADGTQKTVKQVIK